MTDFYPRSPCGERPDVSVVEYKKAKISIHALLAESDSAELRVFQLDKISIHALLAESDNAIRKYQIIPIIFLSTLSLRRATFAGDGRL